MRLARALTTSEPSGLCYSSRRHNNNKSEHTAITTIKIAITAHQAGLGLPDRDYYFDEDKEAIRSKYVRHVAATLALLGGTEAEAEDCANAVLELETKIAATHLTLTERRAPGACISAISRRYLGGISATSQRYLGDISAASRRYLRRDRLQQDEPDEASRAV